MMRARRSLGGAAALLAVAVALTGWWSPAGKSATRPAAVAAAAVQTPMVHPISGLRIVTLTVTHGDHPYRFRVEVADTPETQARGLMFRTAMGADEGMIFPMSDGRPASFWMKNTVIPLDIVFVDLQGRIANIAANAKPYDETPLYSVGPVSGVLELNGGRAAQLGLGPGDLVQW